MKTYSFRKWSLFIATIFSAAIMLLSCQKDNSTFPDPSTLPKGLAGTWVETSTISDTIMFNSDKETGMLILHRGYEIRNGYRLPVIGSDMYQYTVLSDSIRLMGGLSSTWFDETFYFNYDEATLTIHIGKFSKYINSQKTILTFRKVK